MSQILPLLYEMRGRQGMYLGVPSLIRLASFLRGYDLAAERLGGRAPDPFLPAFRDWVHKRFRSNQRSWEETILLHSANEAEAVKQFWELLDEFLRECQRDTPTAELFNSNGTNGSLGDPAKR
jgi:hypothetical protein